jgi:hypothetical protein
MSNLTRFDHDGIELLINTTTGESFASVRGYARMSNKSESTIYRRLKALHEDKLQTTQIQTSGGLQGVALICEDLICEWLPKDNHQMTTQLLKLGVRVFLHKLAGYEIKSTDATQITLAPEIKAELTAIQETLVAMETKRAEENRIVIQMLEAMRGDFANSSEIIAAKAEEKLEAYHAQKADEFRRIREQNEMERFLRRH